MAFGANRAKEQSGELMGAFVPLKVKIKAKGLYEPLKVHFVHANGLWR